MAFSYSNIFSPTQFLNLKLKLIFHCFSSVFVDGALEIAAKIAAHYSFDVLFVSHESFNRTSFVSKTNVVANYDGNGEYVGLDIPLRNLESRTVTV